MFRCENFIRLCGTISCSHALACNIHPKHVNLNQFFLWSSIPAPIDRWKFSFFSFFLKMLHNFNKTILHKWVNYNWQTEELPCFTEIKKLCKKFFSFLRKWEIKKNTTNISRFRKGVTFDQIVRM